MIAEELTAAVKAAAAVVRAPWVEDLNPEAVRRLTDAVDIALDELGRIRRRLV